MNLAKGAWLGPLAGTALIAGALAFSGACNDNVLVPFKSLVTIGKTDKVAIPARPKLDMLWLVDDSASMCQEQANLARNFGTMAEMLTGVDADINVGVITTDMEDAAHQGRLQNKPATQSHLSCERACLEDAHCGGGCLCGVPFVRRCQQDGDCDDGTRCVQAVGSGIKHCASSCEHVGKAHEPTSDKCGAEVREHQVFTCQPVNGQPQPHCALTVCNGDADCNQGNGQRCVQGPDGMSYCRRFRQARTQCRPGVASDCPLGVDCLEQADGTGLCAPTGQCPPPTCDCPRALPKVINSDSATFERDFGCLATVGTKGASFEKGLEAIRKALDPRMTASGGPNRGAGDTPFLRDDAFLAVIILSDENDCSDDGGTTCNPDDGGGCVACLPDGRCRGQSEDEGMRCAKDSLDLDASGQAVHYCRLPKRDASECEHFRDYLRPVGDYADFLLRLKDDPTPAEKAQNRRCESDADCADLAGMFCSRKAKVCIDTRVLVAGIVGPKDHQCVRSCPDESLVIDCVADETCGRACDIEVGDGAFCADRVYDYNEQVNPTCTSTNGQAFNGRRYIDLVARFGELGAMESICGDAEFGGEFTQALTEIAQRIVKTVRPPFCLTHPLFPCRSHEDCGSDSETGAAHVCHGLEEAAEEGEGEVVPPTEGEEEPAAAPTTYCGDTDGLPVDVAVVILEAVAEDAEGPRGVRETPRPIYNFRPRTGPTGFGCFQFVTGGPGAGEEVQLQYRAGLIVD